MVFPASLFTSLAECKVTGDFAPFSTGNIAEVENYISQLLLKLKDAPLLLVGQQEIFSSFIEVKVSKADKSDTYLIQEEHREIETTNGLALYFCTLAPYWFYGACHWSTNWLGFVGGSYMGGASCFLEPESLAQVDHSLWEAEIDLIKSVAHQFRYTLLPVEALTQPSPIDLPFETMLSAQPYRVFDCFFYLVD